MLDQSMEHENCETTREFRIPYQTVPFRTKPYLFWGALVVLGGSMGLGARSLERRWTKPGRFCTLTHALGDVKSSNNVQWEVGSDSVRVGSGEALGVWCLVLGMGGTFGAVHVAAAHRTVVRGRDGGAETPLRGMGWLVFILYSFRYGRSAVRRGTPPKLACCFPGR